MSNFTAVFDKNTRFHGNFTEGYLLFFEPPKNHLHALIHKAYLRYLEAINVKMPPMVITARCYASAVLAMALCPSVYTSVCLSVSPSVTSRCSTKTAKRRITQTTPHDTPKTLVFWCQRSPRNSTGSPLTGAPNAGGVGQNRRLSTNSRLYLENGKR